MPSVVPSQPRVRGLVEFVAHVHLGLDGEVADEVLKLVGPVGEVAGVARRLRQPTVCSSAAEAALWAFIPVESRGFVTHA